MPPGIYCFENKKNGKRYVGQALDLDRRVYEHLYWLNRGKDKATALQRAVNKYGLDSFDVHIIEFCEIPQLNEMEIYYIKHYQSNNKKHGYNLSSGGNNGMIGYKHSKETCRKISEAKKGWKMSDAHKEFIRKLHTGKVVRDETRKKISLANTGKKHPMYGKHHTEEARKKMREKKLGEKSYQFGTKSKNATSKYFGVNRLLSKGHTYWSAYIKVHGEKIYLGSSKDEVDAARRYDKYVAENGLPNPLNFPDEWNQ